MTEKKPDVIITDDPNYGGDMHKLKSWPDLAAELFPDLQKDHPELRKMTLDEFILHSPFKFEIVAGDEAGEVEGDDEKPMDGEPDMKSKESKMNMKPETCSQPAPTKRVFVDLWSNETVLQSRRLVIEVPLDCEADEIKALSGETLNSMADERQVCSWWETEDFEDFEVSDDIHIEEGVPDNQTADLVLVRSHDGELVVVE